jgi:Uma2 family endonuclease
MPRIPVKYYTVEEYFEIEQQHSEHYEYYLGNVFELPKAGEKHNIIVGNVFVHLFTQSRHQGCRTYKQDVRVKVSDVHYAYPDVALVCGKRILEKEPSDTLINPTIILEVLSASTAHYDTVKKAKAYRAMPSLQEYLIISQDEVHIQHYIRQEDDWWMFRETDRIEDALNLPSIGYSLTVSDVYADVKFMPFVKQDIDE